MTCQLVAKQAPTTTIVVLLTLHVEQLTPPGVQVTVRVLPPEQLPARAGRVLPYIASPGRKISERAEVETAIQQGL